MSEIKHSKSFSLHAPTEEERAELAREVRDARTPQTTQIRFLHPLNSAHRVLVSAQGWVIDPAAGGLEHVTLKKKMGPIPKDQEIPRVLDRDRCDALQELLDREAANPDTQEVVLRFHDPRP